METKIVYPLVIIVLIAVSVAVYMFTNQPAGSLDPGKYDGFAQCLTDNGVAMYGTSWCSHCTDQKNTFGSSFDYVDFTDCDEDRASCTAAGVKYYPTWVINDVIYTGSKSLEELSSISGCSLE